MKVESIVTGKIIKLLLNGEDYRIEVLTLIDSAFFDFMSDFLGKISEIKESKLGSQSDWYKKVFLDPKLPKDQIAINSGLNMKTISNMFNSATKEIVIAASNQHFAELQSALDEYSKTAADIGCTLSWKGQKSNGDFSLAESYLIMNTLAVKRAAIRGGAWSTIGKRVEKPLMLTLCNLFEVPKQHYDLKVKHSADSSVDFVREIDFFLRSDSSNRSQFKCEVKLMGHGNPESADAVIARDSSVFVADKLSDTNKKQLDSLSVKWVELRSENGFMRFGKVLSDLGIPHSNPSKQKLLDLDSLISSVVDQ